MAGLAQPASEWALPPAVGSLYEALQGKRDAGPAEHQVGGHPDPVQGTVQLELEEIERALSGAGGQATGWRLLAQVDTDEGAEMMWGDVGMLYFMIRPDDLQARRFEQARFTWQCM
jgi:uncharacterized protein YwqG